MTRTTAAPARPRPSAIPHRTAMRLAATEYQRFADLLRSLRPEDWAKPTECPGWDVRAMAAHVLGMAEMSASVRENLRQFRLAQRRAAASGRIFVDELTALQVEERADMTPRQIMERFEARAPKAARGRRLTPGFVRRRPLGGGEPVGPAEDPWTIGYLNDVILTRDPWTHRGDIVRATGAEHVLTPGHDGVIVADVVAEWAQRHGEPYSLRLTGPAGGTWTSGEGGPHIEMDAVEFCRILSGRGDAHGERLLETQVPF